ncbi:MAG: mandelate racemase/muconate lactonizing enzyme family protein [Candidatus Dormibacteraceae bacterium]
MSDDEVEVWPLVIPMAVGELRTAILVLHRGGRTGLGEAPAVAARGDDLAALCADLRSPHQRSNSARAAWASAELDLAGQRRGLSVAELLGGPRRRRVACSHLVLARTPAAVEAEIRVRRAEGFRTFKLKSEDAGGAMDQERLGYARHAAGPQGRLRLDLNGRSLVAEAGRLDGFDLEFVEQPLAAPAPARCWRELRVRAAADESLADPEAALELARMGVTLAIKLATVGGPEAAIGLDRAASGQVLLGSSLETSIGLAAAAHTACALLHEPLDCGLATASLLESDISTGWRAAGPWLDLPEGPGLGVGIDRRRLLRYRIEL